MMNKPTSPVVVAATLAAATWGLIGPVESRAAEPVQFNRDIRPILAQRCFKCHGMDDTGRKGRLRLDVREAALKGGKSGMPAIVPGKPDQSEIVRRLFSDEQSERMPPPATKTALTAEEKEKIRAWI